MSCSTKGIEKSTIEIASSHSSGGVKIDNVNSSKKSSDSNDSNNSSLITYIMYIVLIITTIFTYPNDWDSSVTYKHVWYYGWITALSTGLYDDNDVMMMMMM